MCGCVCLVQRFKSHHSRKNITSLSQVAIEVNPIEFTAYDEKVLKIYKCVKTVPELMEYCIIPAICQAVALSRYIFLVISIREGMHPPPFFDILPLLEWVSSAYVDKTP